jgi:hypothetical protein
VQDEDLQLFTLAEASAMLPDLRDKLRLLQRGKRELRSINETLRDISPAMRANGSGQRAHELELKAAELVSRMGAVLAEVEDLGVLVKDIDQGLVDFPALRDGRVVFLCWMVDEPEIGYWHEIDDGFRGRRAL